MQVKCCNYYAYRREKTYHKSSLTVKIKECFNANARRYGSRRIASALKIGRNTVRKVLQSEGLKAIQPKSFKPKTTDSKHGFGYNENLLKEAKDESQTNGAVFIGDITYLRLQSGGFCYLAVLQDKFTRRIVGWKVSERMTAQLVIDVFNQARKRYLMKKRAIIHTARGSQYASVEYRRLLFTNGFRQSMSAAGNCYDNAQAESFFSRFKAELLENGKFESIEQAKSEIFSYIEGYYNRTRIHSSLGKSPAEFEKELKIKTKERSGKESFVYR